MKKAINERQNLSQVWRAGRMLAGLTQNQLAKALSIPQSSISKYETMSLEPSASDWFRFCQYIGIDAHKALNLGYIDSRTKFKSKLYAGSLFPLPLKYKMDFSLKVRELVPFKDAVIEALGVEAWKEFLSTHGLNGEMFLIYDFQVSLRLLLDIVKWGESKGLDLIPAAVRLSSDLSHHGLVQENLSGRPDPVTLLKKLVEVQNLYQNALKTDLDISSGEAVVSLKLQQEVSDLFDPESLITFRKYKASSLQEILKNNTPSFKGFKFHSSLEELQLRTKTA